jgi:hypothetical protein
MELGVVKNAKPPAPNALHGLRAGRSEQLRAQLVMRYHPLHAVHQALGRFQLVHIQGYNQTVFNFNHGIIFPFRYPVLRSMNHRGHRETFSG